jgi:hypothetical protein
MTRQGSSLTINAQQPENITIGAHAQSSHMISNHISNNQPNNTPSITIPTHINSSNIFAPPNLLNTPPNIIPQLIIDQNNLPILNSPNTEFNAINLSQNRPITFSSQTLISDPHKLSPNRNPTKHKLIHGPYRPSTRASKQIKSDLTFAHPKPEISTRPTALNINPTRNKIPTSQSQNAEDDNESHSEKKRRREDDNKSSTLSSEVSEHFLSADPGSQACRDQ